MNYAMLEPRALKIMARGVDAREGCGESLEQIEMMILARYFFTR
jgi:hypothetical protein